MFVLITTIILQYRLSSHLSWVEKKLHQRSNLGWIVVRATRCPNLEAEMPADWNSIAERYSRLSKVGHFASNSFAKSADDDGIDRGPLLRGGPMIVSFEGRR